MIADINMADYSSSGFNFIGHFGGSWPHPDNQPFTGVFDGNNHAIVHLVRRYEEPNRFYGLALFAYVAGVEAEIRNLGIIDPCIIGGTQVKYVSALVGVLYDAKVKNCFVEGGILRGQWGYIGGLVGGNTGWTVSRFTTDYLISPLLQWEGCLT